MQTATIQHHVSTSIEATRARAIMERKISEKLKREVNFKEAIEIGACECGD
jgi:hypothetical protein